MSKRNTMSSTETFSIQGGRGGFAVNRYPLQKGRGLSGLFASLVRKIAPFGKSFLRTGKRFVQSETGKSIINDTINTAAAAASSALLENNPEEAKKQVIRSLKRSGNKAKDVAGKIAKNKLEKVLTGSGNLKNKSKRKKKKKCPAEKKLSLLED